MSEQETTIEHSCYGCGDTTTNTDDWFEYEERWFCSDCYRVCDRCTTFTGDDYFYISDRGESWCEGCKDSRANFCDSCEEWLSDTTSMYNAVDCDSWQCENCASNSWNWCDNCDRYYDSECDCDGRVENLIHSYSYKPDPIFRVSNYDTMLEAPGLWFGLELECEVSQDIGNAANKASDLEDYFYLKYDSSIGKPGFEIVSHPYSFEYWQDTDNKFLEYVEDIRVNHHARAWDATSSCGLHIHISRTGFTSGAHAHRFLALIYDNSKQMSLLGGRKGSNYAKFSDIYKFDDYGKPYKAIYDKLHNARNTDRYSAVNTLNLHTLELRWFRGTMARSGILASIQLAHASVEYTRYLTVANVRDGALRWDKFSGYVLEHRDIYPDLALKIERMSAINLDKIPTLQA